MKFNPAYLQVGILTGVELEVLVLLIKWCASLGRAGYGADKADTFLRLAVTIHRMMARPLFSRRTPRSGILRQ